MTQQPQNGALSMWDTIKDCKPAISPNTEFESSLIRDERWMVLRNRINGDHIRLNGSAAGLVARIQNDHDDVFSHHLDEATNEKDVGNQDSAETLVRLLAPLCQSGMLSLGSEKEDERLLNQHMAQTAASKKRRFANPLAVRVPLHNPDVWLTRLVESTRNLLGRPLLWLLILLITTGACLAVLNFAEVSSEFKRVAASPTHWWLYVLLYPLLKLKLFHEFAHAITIKRFGGAVHETGITFLVLMPIPYVDASDAWLFPKRSQRILVSAAGMVIECTFAAIGLIIFLLVQPGLLREFAFAVFVLGSFSTLVFNANPLLKFDGYYILQDWLDIPNLAGRSRQYCLFLLKKNVLRISNAVSPVTARGEKPWLLSYGILSFAYRFFITFVIALFLASKYMLLGVALGLFALYQLLIKPVLALVRYLSSSVELTGIRRRSVLMTAGMAVVCTLSVAIVPLPSSTRAEGVVWVPSQAQVFSGQTGVVDELLVKPGTFVSAGQTLVRMRAPQLRTRLEVLESELTAARVEYRAVQRQDKVQAKAIATDIASLESEQQTLSDEVQSLDIKAEHSGQFVLNQARALLGRRVEEGELLAYIVNKQDLTVKAVLTQQRMERLQAGVLGASVRLADRFSEEVDATLTRQTPAGSNTLPSPALAYDGSSGIAVSSGSDDEIKTLESVFHIELALPQMDNIAGIGGRAYVTLEHEPESLGKRWWRSTRQLLLKRLTV